MLNLGNVVQTYNTAQAMLGRNLTNDQRDYWQAVKARALKGLAHG